MKILGICRFSYPAIGGFKRDHDSVAEREAYLYAPERMELRFRHFEALTLPSVAAQTDPDFTLLVQIGQNMPRPQLERLHDLVAPVPQVRIVTREPMRQRRAAQLTIKEALGDDTEESIQFRLDDDDAVSVKFVRSIRWFARHTAKMRRRWRHMAIEFSSGYTVRLSENGIEAEEVQTPFWPCGLAAIFQPGDPKTIMNYGHHKLHTFMPTMIHPTPRMYIRAKHDDNDSVAKFKTGTLQALTDEQRAFFKAQFNVDEDHVRRVFCAPAALRGTA